MKYEIEVGEKGRYQWVSGIRNEAIYREALRIVGLSVDKDPPLEVLVEQFAHHWQEDPMEPELAFGPYRRDNKLDHNLEVNVIVKDDRGIPDVMFSVSGTDLPLMTAHAIIILHTRLREERCPVLEDKLIELSKGERFRFVVQDLMEADGLGNRKLHWWLYTVWGRKQTILFEDDATWYPNEEMKDQVDGILRRICSRPASFTDTDAQAEFRELYADEILEGLKRATARDQQHSEPSPQ